MPQVWIATIKHLNINVLMVGQIIKFIPIERALRYLEDVKRSDVCTISNPSSSCYYEPCPLLLNVYHSGSWCSRLYNVKPRPRSISLQDLEGVSAGDKRYSRLYPGEFAQLVRDWLDQIGAFWSPLKRYERQVIVKSYFEAACVTRNLSCTLATKLTGETRPWNWKDLDARSAWINGLSMAIVIDPSPCRMTTLAGALFHDLNGALDVLDFASV